MEYAGSIYQLDEVTSSASLCFRTAWLWVVDKLSTKKKTENTQEKVEV